MSKLAAPMNPFAPEDQYKYIVSEPGNIFHAKYYMTDVERKKLIAELNVSALVLFEYYLRQACKTKSPEISDAIASDELGLNIHTVGQLRRNLDKSGWIKFVKFPRHPVTGQVACLYYLGKAAVLSQSQKSARAKKSRY
jgi:hypothetical protein